LFGRTSWSFCIAGTAPNLTGKRGRPESPVPVWYIANSSIERTDVRTSKPMLFLELESPNDSCLKLVGAARSGESASTLTATTHRKRRSSSSYLARLISTFFSRRTNWSSIPIRHDVRLNNGRKVKVEHSTDGATMPGRRRRDALELSVAYGFILLAVWTPPQWQRAVSLVALACVLAATWTSFDGWRAMGLSGKGFRRSLWVVGAALLLAAVGVILAGKLRTLHAPPNPSGFVRRFWGYSIWAFLQEFLLLDFFLLRLLRMFPGRKAAVLAATMLLAVAHLPNPILTVLTMFWGWVSCRLFLQYRNIYTLAMAHAMLGICIAVTIPGPIVHNMRVGLGYLTYRPLNHLGQRVAW